MKQYYYKSLSICALAISLNTTAQINVHSEDFSTSLGTWSTVNISEPTNQWTANAGYVEIEGANGVGDEDWLISPSINMDVQNSEYFLFDYNDANPGSLLELYYSTNYNGSPSATDVNNATWINLPLNLIDINTVVCFDLLFQLHPAIDVSTISGTAVYFGFKYTSTTGVGKYYKIDNVRIEAEYYASIFSDVQAGDRCAELKTEIHDLIRNQRKVYYTSTNYDLWDALLQTDTRMNDTESAIIVWDMFTDIPIGLGEFEFDHCTNRDSGGSGSGEGLFYNREHSFPKSWWGGGTLAADTQYVDLHHIVPSDRAMNNAKSNHPPGMVTNATITGTNGFKVGTNASYPCGTIFFEPIDEYKGDYARIYLYFATRYEHNMVAWSTISTEGDCAMSGDPYTSFEPWLIDMLLDWHANDPVSTKEINRNNAVYAIQGNRNPFIDNPMWIEYIWGDNLGTPCTTVGIKEDKFTNEVKVYPNPTKDEVTIELQKTYESIKVRILNTLGEEVSNTTFNHTSSCQFTLNQKPGYYLLELKVDDENVLYKRIVKQ